MTQPAKMHVNGRMIENVRGIVYDLYQSRGQEVPFHGWHHVSFVASKAILFARELGADRRLVEVAALVHDVNYLVDPTTDAVGGTDLRRRILQDAGLDGEVTAHIEAIVLQAEVHTRTADISTEAKALSDADTLFKALPITPVMLAPLYMRETGRTLRQLAEKIVREQVPLKDGGLYFYSDSARRRYLSWGETNLQLWRFILDSLGDPDVVQLLEHITNDEANDTPVLNANAG